MIVELNHVDDGVHYFHVLIHLALLFMVERIRQIRFAVGRSIIYSYAQIDVAATKHVIQESVSFHNLKLFDDAFEVDMRACCGLRLEKINSRVAILDYCVRSCLVNRMPSD